MILIILILSMIFTVQPTRVQAADITPRKRAFPQQIRPPPSPGHRPGAPPGN
ncbi:hypothetical protein I3760_14G082500 [Carya illinoinensis]|nr:hypothetical protein I3760_14G082500 [Carya illinoinensis]